MEKTERLLEKLEKIFGISRILKQRDDLYFVNVSEEKLVAVLTHLRDVENFTHLVLMSNVDYIERGVFQLTYILHNYETHIDLAILVEIPRENPVMDSIHHLWKQGWAYQREIKEMYGVNFPNSPRVDEAFVLEGWEEIPPMRRDFDTQKYSEETYFPRGNRQTNDPKTYMAKKLYPQGEK